MIDLHNHILPGLDDGAADREESVAMAKMACNDGIKAIVCTPHWVIGHYENDAATIRAKVAELRNHLQAKGVAIDLYPGSELRLDPTLQSGIKSGSLLTINDTGRYALIELPMYLPPTGVEPFLTKIRQKGIVPVIAHPERYIWALAQPEKFYSWVASGCLMQLTAASLLGHFGRDIQALSVQLLEHGLIHVLATDSHGPRLRSPKLSQGRRKAAQILGDRLSSQLVSDNPIRIVRGQALEIPAPVPFTPRSRWHGLSALRASAGSLLQRIKGRNSRS